MGEIDNILHEHY